MQISFAAVDFLSACTCKAISNIYPKLKLKTVKKFQGKKYQNFLKRLRNRGAV